MIAVAILVGLMVFYVMERHAKHLLTNNLQSVLQNNVELVKTEFRQGYEKGLTVATRPFLIDQLQRANTHDDKAATMQALDRGAQSFLATGLSAVALFSKDGQELARAGAFVQQPALTAPIHVAEHVQLLFKDTFFCGRISIS